VVFLRFNESSSRLKQKYRQSDLPLEIIVQQTAVIIRKMPKGREFSLPFGLTEMDSARIRLVLMGSDYSG
jgi:hypothetical protein